MKRLGFAIVLVVSAGVLPQPVWAQAGGGAGGATSSDFASGESLAQRIPSVTRRLFEKRNRLELYPGLGLTLNDPFYNNIRLAGGMAFHIFEWLAIAASGEYFVSLQSPVDVSGPGKPPAPELNRPSYGARMELVWSPFYGKMSLFAERVLHFDTFLSVGAGVVGPTQASPRGAGTFAVGQHIFFNQWLALRWELRDQIFMLDRNPAGSSGPRLQNLFSGTIGVSFWVPPRFERETL